MTITVMEVKSVSIRRRSMAFTVIGGLWMSLLWGVYYCHC